MNKTITWLLIFTFVSSTQTSEQNHARRIVKKVFSSAGLGLSVRQQTQIEKLLSTIYSASPYQQAVAAHKAVKSLEKELEHKKVASQQSDALSQPLIAHNTKALLAQKKHLEDFARIAFHKLSWQSYIAGFLNDCSQQCVSLFKRNAQPTSQELAQHLIAYTRLEREHIFSNYLQTHYLMAAHDDIELPKMIRFWNYPRRRFALLNGVKQFACHPQVQAAEVAEVAAEVAVDATGAAGAEAGGFAVLGASSTEVTADAAEFAANATESEALEDAASIGSKAGTEEDAEETAAESAVVAAEDGSLPASEFGGEGTEIATESNDAAFQSALKDASSYSEFLDSIGSDAKNLTDEQLQQLSAKFTQTMEGLAPATEVIQGPTADAVQSVISDRVGELQAQFAEISDTQAEAKVVLNKLKSIASSLKDWSAFSESAAAAEGGSAAVDVEIQSSIKALQDAMAPSLKSLGQQVAISDTAKMTMEMMAQMEVMMGAQLAVAWVSQKYAAEYLALTKKRNTITASWQAQISKMAATRDAKMAQIKANYTAKLLQINDAQKALVPVFSSEKNYLLQSLIKADVSKLFISTPMALDQYFYGAPMLTPEQPQVPLFNSSSQTSSSSGGWTLSPQSPPVIKQTTGGWTLSQNSPLQVTDQGTGGWNLSPVGTPTPTISSTGTVSAPSTLLTIPKSFPTNPMPHPWYNPFRIYGQGNWVFDGPTNSFYQYKAAPSSSKEYPTGGDPEMALFNSIFTTYIPPIIKNDKDIPTYEIQVEIELYNAVYPFFAGLMFNSGRWISGVVDLMYQHRLFGLYGDTDKKIQVCAGETVYTQQTNQLQTFDAIWPLKQIMLGSAFQKASSALSATGAIIKNPLYPTTSTKNPVTLEMGKTYILTVVTQPTNMMLTLEEKGTTGNTTIFGPYTIANRNPFVFIYHNIGFISSGCSARFSLLKPEQLVYNSQALTAFKNAPPTSPTKSGNQT